MTDQPLSPAAQAVLNTVLNEAEPRSAQLQAIADAAAALRAAAKFEEIKPGDMGPCDSLYVSYLLVRLFSERDFNYSLTIEKDRIKVAVERKLLAIAAELEGTTTPTES